MQTNEEAVVVDWVAEFIERIGAIVIFMATSLFICKVFFPNAYKKFREQGSWSAKTLWRIRIIRFVLLPLLFIVIIFLYVKFSS
ncbi:MAG: hypothetical protein Q8O22_04605 [Candidatus Omnitrophota bacterium]|nr:hypothetical protein [Candidatus Omnitrophota bacterium]